MSFAANSKSCRRTSRSCPRSQPCIVSIAMVDGMYYAMELPADIIQNEPSFMSIVCIAVDVSMGQSSSSDITFSVVVERDTSPRTLMPRLFVADATRNSSESYKESVGTSIACDKEAKCSGSEIPAAEPNQG